MKRIVKRVIQEVEAYQLSIIATMLYSMPRPISAVDAIAVFPGMGEEWRLVEAVRLWNDNTRIRYLLICGMYDGENTYQKITLSQLARPPFNLSRTENVIFQNNANFTREQTDWLVQTAQSHDIQSVALVVSPYHLMRAYFTAVCSCSRFLTNRIAFIPIPVPVAPTVVVPETQVNGWRMAHGEIARIIEYQKKGDVATFLEMQDYISWIWTQDLMQ